MNLSTIKDVLEEKVKKVAIANPSNAPYGAKAIETLKYYKLYNTVKSKIVYGYNIAQTAQFAAFGAVEIGFIALSEALSPAMKKENGKCEGDSAHAKKECCKGMKEEKEVEIIEKK